MNIHELDRDSPLFSDMAESSISYLESIARELSVSMGETVFRINSPADHLYLITSGTLALRMAGPSGPAITVQTLGDGSLVGLSWRLSPFRWQWTCQAVVDSELTTFEANDVLAACEQDPQLDADLWRTIARESARRLQDVRLQLLDVYRKN